MFWLFPLYSSIDIRSHWAWIKHIKHKNIHKFVFIESVQRFIDRIAAWVTLSTYRFIQLPTFRRFFRFSLLTVQNFSSVQSLIHFICIKTFHSFVLDRNLLFFHHFLAEMTHKCIDCSRSFLMRLIFRSTSFCSGHHFFAVAYRLIFACQ